MSSSQKRAPYVNNNSSEITARAMNEAEDTMMARANEGPIFNKPSNSHTTILPFSHDTPLKPIERSDDLTTPNRAHEPTTKSTPKQQEPAKTEKVHTWLKDVEPGEDPMAFRLANIPPNAADKHWNIPAARGDWEFVPGTDLTVAVANQPNAAKFLLIRQRPDDEKTKEIRIFPGFAEFDWGSGEDILSLNKYREQVIGRTEGVGRIGAPWTQLERDTMELILKEVFESGVANGCTIDWKKVVKNLTKRFEGVVQEAGAPLAQSTKIVNGFESGHYRIPRKLLEARTGIPVRTAKNTQNAANKYASIVKLIRDNLPPGTKVRRQDPRFERVNNSDEWLAKQALKKEAIEKGETWESDTGAEMTKTKSKGAKKRKESGGNVAAEGEYEDEIPKTKSAKKIKFSTTNEDQPTDHPFKGPEDPKGPQPVSSSPNIGFQGVLGALDSPHPRR